MLSSVLAVSNLPNFGKQYCSWYAINHYWLFLYP